MPAPTYHRGGSIGSGALAQAAGLRRGGARRAREHRVGAAHTGGVVAAAVGQSGAAAVRQLAAWRVPGGAHSPRLGQLLQCLLCRRRHHLWGWRVSCKHTEPFQELRGLSSCCAPARCVEGAPRNAPSAPWTAAAKPPPPPPPRVGGASTFGGSAAARNPFGSEHAASGRRRFLTHTKSSAEVVWGQ